MYSRLLAGMIAVMSVGGMSKVVNPSYSNERYSGDASTRIIVEMNEGVDNLSKSEIISTQDNAILAIKKNVTRNFKVVDRYSIVANAVVLDVNKGAVEEIKALPQVASVTYDKMHAKRDLAVEDRYSVKLTK